MTSFYVMLKTPEPFQLENLVVIDWMMIKHFIK